MKGRIYRIIDNTNANVYFGSTINKINNRITNHKADYKRYLEGSFIYMTSFEIIKNNNYNVELVEEVECETKYELHNRERYYIENNKCVNKVIPNRTYKEWKDDNKEYRKEYHINNIEHIKEYHKEYRKNNKEYFKQHNTKKITCECGDIVCKKNLFRHKRTKKHLNKTI